MENLAYAGWIPALPLISFLIVGLIIRPRSDKWSGVVATSFVFLSALLSFKLSWDYLGSFDSGSFFSVVAWSFEWMSYQEKLGVNMGVLVDPLSLLLMMVVTTVSTLVHFYSMGYMKGEEGYGRYFTLLNLFTFSMLGLVVAPSIVQTFVFWELVGASSFFLIGFYFSKPSAVAASKKAFIVTRFADLGFLLGIIILGYMGYQFSDSSLSVFDFLFLNSENAVQSFSSYGWGLSFALLLLFLGAAGKSAMFPLHIWLPDAMEGPTPVSALIHAATMVVAGVYLVARLFPLFLVSELALEVVAIVGAFTCLFAAVIACTQDDIKRVLAFSTLSQIGYMMLSLGVSSSENTLGYTASLFHLFTHAFFKALLFLGAGAVIHAVHSNSIWDMGGLRKKMPLTHITFLIATLAIAGVPPLSGFFSKDEILLSSYLNQNYFIFMVGLFVALLTAFYMFRIYIVTFLGVFKTKAAENAHDVNIFMGLPLLILAVLSIVAGWAPFKEYLYFMSPPQPPHGLLVPVLATSAGLLGVGLSFFIYGKDSQKSKKWTESMGGLYCVIKNKFYIDEIYLFVTQKVIFNMISAPIAWFDRQVVDGSMNATAWVIRTTGQSLRYLQTGQIQNSAGWFVVGSLILLLLFYTP